MYQLCTLEPKTASVAGLVGPAPQNHEGKINSPKIVKTDAKPNITASQEG
jgi:hypothetical protein